MIENLTTRALPFDTGLNSFSWTDLRGGKGVYQQIIDTLSLDCFL